MPPKPDLVFHTAPIAVETTHSAFTIHLSLAKPAQDIFHATRPMAPIIEDWVSDSEDESEPNDPQSAPNFVQTSEHAKLSEHFVLPIEAPILDATPNPTILTKSKPVSVTAARPGNPQHALKDKGVIDSGCSRHMTRNISYLSDFEEINRGYVAFGGNSKGGKITGKDVGLGHLVIASTFAGSIVIPSAETMWPRNATLLNQNSHLENLAYNFSCHKVCRTVRRWSSCSSLDFEKTRMSSMNTMTNLSRNSWKIRFIKSMNTTGALVRPKGITKN
nr:hypothetical protein [Tanacetum cinerariifolium]